MFCLQCGQDLFDSSTNVSVGDQDRSTRDVGDIVNGSMKEIQIGLINGILN